MNKKPSKAFSLIELSIVILIIGVLIAAVGQGIDLLYDARLKAAQMLTQSSRVASIKNLVTWFETTQESSFSAAETSNGSTISTWYDINPQMPIKNNATQPSGTANLHPIYTENCINNLPCLKFDGANSFLTTSQNFGTPSSFNLFVVAQITVKGTTDDNDSTLIAATTGASFRLHVGPYDSFDLQFEGGNDALSTGIIKAGSTYIFEIIDNGNNAYTYANGVNRTQSAATTTTLVKNLGIFEIGAYSHPGIRNRYLNGKISEIIIFDRNLTTKERVSVESYLGKKWNIPLQ